MATREVSCCGCDWIPPAKDHLTIGFAPKACSDDLTIGFAPRPAMIVFLAQNDTPLTLDLHKVVGKTLHYSPKAQRWFTGDKAHDRIRKNHPTKQIQAHCVSVIHQPEFRRLHCPSTKQTKEMEVPLPQKLCVLFGILEFLGIKYPAGNYFI